MNATVAVRRAQPGDLPQILALAQGTAEAPHWTEAAYAACLLEVDALQRRALFVATAAETVQGFAAASAVADEAELESIAVATAERRSGLGSRLLRAVELWAREGGARGLALEVRSANRSARAFYVSRGFAEAGTRRAYYRDPADDATLLRKSLPADGSDKLEPEPR